MLILLVFFKYEVNSQLTGTGKIKLSTKIFSLKARIFKYFTLRTEALDRIQALARSHRCVVV